MPLVTGDLGEDYEVTVAFQALRTVGHEGDAVCPDREAGETAETAVHEVRGDQTNVESRGHDFELTATLADVDPADYDALVLPGGPTPAYVPSFDAVEHVFTADKPVAAVCHAMQILTAADVCGGDTCTACPALETDVRDAGGEWAEGVARDRTLVTGQAWPDHPEWLAEFLDDLGTEIRHADPVTADWRPPGCDARLQGDFNPLMTTLNPK